MKTEQELKDALEDIFFDALTDTSNPPYYTDKVDPENDGYWQCKVYELCADELIKRGYGDISEYKAEIERLKEKNNELNKERWSLEEELKKKEFEITYARNNGYEKGYDECEEYTKGEIKKAKINILRELKERIKTAIDTYYDSDEENEGYFIAEDAIDDIDKLIEEIENEN